MKPEDVNEPTPANGADRSTDPDAVEPRRRTPRTIRILLWALVIAVAIVVLFGWVFPWVESIQQDPTLGA